MILHWMLIWLSDAPNLLQIFVEGHVEENVAAAVDHGDDIQEVELPWLEQMADERETIEEQHFSDQNHGRSKGLQKDPNLNKYNFALFAQ